MSKNKNMWDVFDEQNYIFDYYDWSGQCISKDVLRRWNVLSPETQSLFLEMQQEHSESGCDDSSHGALAVVVARNAARATDTGLEL